MSFIEPLSKIDFENLLNKHEGFILLDFHASWCGPCVRLKPILENLSQDPDIMPIVSIYSVDVDFENELAELFAVRGIPALHLIKLDVKGKFEVIKSWVGLMDIFTLKMNILKAINDLSPEIKA